MMMAKKGASSESSSLLSKKEKKMGKGNVGPTYFVVEGGVFVKGLRENAAQKFGVLIRKAKRSGENFFAKIAAKKRDVFVPLCLSAHHLLVCSLCCFAGCPKTQIFYWGGGGQGV